jgi:hypothetical protein
LEADTFVVDRCALFRRDLSHADCVRRLNEALDLNPLA